MPVTVRSQQVRHVSGAGKKAPINLRYDPTKQQLINIRCECRIPNPIMIDYTVAGSYTDTLPSLPNGYVWRINGTIISGGAGGGGGGGALFIPINTFIDGGGGQTNSGVSSIPVLVDFPSGASVTSVVGLGGTGGLGGQLTVAGAMGGIGGASSILCNSIFLLSPPAAGGSGGIPGVGSPTGQTGGSGSGSSGSGGSGGNGNTGSGSGSSGLNGTDGRVVFTATPFQI